MKKVDQLFTVILVPVDAIMVLVAFIVAYQTRASSIPLPVIYLWPFDQYIELALWIIPVFILAFALAGAYGSKREGLKEFGQIIVGASLGAMALVLWVFLNRSDFFSRLIVFYIWILSIIGVGLGRTVLELIRANLYLFGFRKKNLVIVGNLDETTMHLASQIKNRPSLGYNLYGFISKDKINEPFKYLGQPDEIESIIQKNPVDEIIFANQNYDDEQLFYYMRVCQECSVTFKAIPNHAQVGARTLRFDAFEGIPIIEFKGTPLDSWGVVIKRVLDVILSTLSIIVFSPVMLVIAIAIKIDSKGPIIYKNTRVGNRGNFETLKFRTMTTEFCTGENYGGSRAEELENKLIAKKNIKKGSAVYKIGGDPRVTSVGNFLRRTSLDELPQFFNVLIGNMSMVGPRPHQPREVKNYTPEQRKLLLIKPGITGLAQISGRSDLTFDEESRLDIFYLENWSVWLDFLIIAKTFGAVFRGKGSY